MSSRLFAYGTLMPRDDAAVDADGWSADAVRGRLFDMGEYPALVDLDDSAAGWVEGYVRSVDAGELESFDRWEEVDVDMYRRVKTTTRSGSHVWVYVYARPLPPEARGPLPRWKADVHAQ
jgi:gamma-glutamylcyclotransferase (GGCT)/AIG2-like uncharacterized protein YtfP